MADETPPLDDARLAEIRNHAETVRSWIKWPAAPAILDLRNPEPDAPSEVPMVAIRLGMDVLTLLAAYDRLRAREAAAMAIVRQVDQADAIALRMAAQSAEYLGTGASDAGYDCQWCHQYILASNEHAPDCPITTARALLAQE